MDCGAEKYFDHVSGSCRPCSVLCERTRGIRQECLDNCPSYVTTTTTRAPLVPTFPQQSFDDKMALTTNVDRGFETWIYGIFIGVVATALIIGAVVISRHIYKRKWKRPPSNATSAEEIPLQTQTGDAEAPLADSPRPAVAQQEQTHRDTSELYTNTSVAPLQLSQNSTGSRNWKICEKCKMPNRKSCSRIPARFPSCSSAPSNISIDLPSLEPISPSHQHDDFSLCFSCSSVKDIALQTNLDDSFGCPSGHSDDQSQMSDLDLRSGVCSCTGCSQGIWNSRGSQTLPNKSVGTQFPEHVGENDGSARLVSSANINCRST